MVPFSMTLSDPWDFKVTRVAIIETVRDRDIVTMEDKLGTRMRSMNGAISMTLSDLAKCSMT